jgi:hypothetical protein
MPSGCNIQVMPSGMTATVTFLLLQLGRHISYEAKSITNHHHFITWLKPAYTISVM